MDKQLLVIICESLEDQDTYFVYDLSDENIEDLSEGEGALKGVPTGLRKMIVSKPGESRDSYYGKGPIAGGENSSREESPAAKSISGLKSHISAAMAGNKMAIIHKNGKPIAAVSGANHGVSGARDEFHVHGTPDSTDINIETKYGTGRRGYTWKKNVVNANHNKSGALNAVMDHVSKHIDTSEPEKDHFKKNKYHVVSIGPDEKRHETQLKRNKNTYYGNGKDAPEKSDAKITWNAANKIAVQKLGDKTSPHSIARDIHQKLGDAIKSGNQQEAENHIKALKDHFERNRRNALSREDDNITKYADKLIDLKKSYGPGGYDFMKSSYKNDLAKMRQQANESLLEAFEYLSEDQLDDIANIIIEMLKD